MTNTAYWNNYPLDCVTVHGASPQTWSVCFNIVVQLGSGEMVDTAGFEPAAVMVCRFKSYLPSQVLSCTFKSGDSNS